MNNEIVIFDSGVGGISTLKEILKVLPKEEYIYFADTLHAPYGTKSDSEIVALVDACAAKIAAIRPKAVVVACNTVTTLCIDTLRNTYPEMLICGIQPAIRPAVIDQNKKTLVFVTNATANNEKFKKFVAKFDGTEIVVFPLVEGASKIENAVSDIEFENYLLKITKALDKGDFSSVVLGCTHFVLKKHVFEKVFDKATVYDGNVGLAKHLFNELASRNLLSKSTIDGSVLFNLTAPASEEFFKYISTFNF